MTKRSDGYVAALVARLGGDVLITDEEAARAPKFSLKRDPKTATVRIWVEAETLVGEIVTAPEPQSIMPRMIGHECEAWQIIVDHDGRRRYCSACGVDQ